MNSNWHSVYYYARRLQILMDVNTVPGIPDNYNVQGSKYITQGCRDHVQYTQVPHSSHTFSRYLTLSVQCVTHGLNTIYTIKATLFTATITLFACITHDRFPCKCDLFPILKKNSCR